MGCGLSRNGRPRLDGRRRTTTDLRIEKPDDQFYTPVTTPTNDGRSQFSGGGASSPQSPMHPRLQINTQRSIESPANINNRCQEDEDEDDGRKISSTNGVQLLMGSPSFREYCHPASRAHHMDINGIGNEENKSGKTQ